MPFNRIIYVYLGQILKQFGSINPFKSVTSASSAFSIPDRDIKTNASHSDWKWLALFYGVFNLAADRLDHEVEMVVLIEDTILAERPCAPAVDTTQT